MVESQANKKRRLDHKTDLPVWSTDLVSIADACARAIQHGQDATENAFTISSSPYPVLRLHSLFNEDFLRAVKSQLLHTPYFPRSSDLFSYSGTSDLSEVESSSPLGRLRDAIYEPRFVDFLESVFGFELNAQVDMSSHIYKQGDFLACHSDDIVDTTEGRRIAFIIYLVDTGWSASDGGELGFFDTNSQGDPRDIVKTSAPTWNSMSLFEATPTSFHEVGEVFASSATKCRLSISGWFHGPLATRLALRDFVQPDLTSPHPSLEYLLNPEYLMPDKILDLRAQFAETSSLQLFNFLRPSFFSDLCNSILRTSPFKTKAIGPASVRRFHLAGKTRESLLQQVSECFTHNSHFHKFLESITSSRIKKCRVHARLFTQGCYSIIHDQGQDPLGLDVILNLGNGTNLAWPEQMGGRLTYTARNEGPEDDDTSTHEENPILFSALPEPNSLTLVLRDEGVLKAVEWVRTGLTGLRGRCDIEALYLLNMRESSEEQDEEFKGISDSE